MISLRFATVADAPALLEIYRPYVKNTTISFETEVPSLAEFEGRIREYAEFYPYLLAEEEGTILGYAYAHAFHERSAYRWTVESTVYVSEAARGKHVGKRLYTALLSLLKAQGIQNVCAVVTIPNEPSMAFHTAMGFQVGNLLPGFGYKLGQWRGVAYLYLPLGSHEEVPAEPISVWDLPEETVKNLLKS